MRKGSSIYSNYIWTITLSLQTIYETFSLHKNIPTNKWKENERNRISILRIFLVAQMVKCLPAMWETRVRFLGREDPLEKEMATHSRTLAWEIPWTEEPGGLPSMGSQRFWHDWATSLHFTSLYFIPPPALNRLWSVSLGASMKSDVDSPDYMLVDPGRRTTDKVLC